MDRIFEDRRQAGRLLAAQLSFLVEKEKQKTILLALPRGGVPVANEISQALGISFDILIVRKIGHPLQPEYGIGAITEGDFIWMDPDAVGASEVETVELQKVIESEKQEITRRKAIYRKDRPLTSLKGKTVIIVDDGLATGVTARVAAKYAKDKGAEKVILAVPVCSVRTADQLRLEVDEVICLNESPLFFSVEQFYQNFDQVTDEEVMDLLPSSSLSPEGPRPRNLILKNEDIAIPNDDGTETKGLLSLPSSVSGLVIFAHGSGSGCLSSRNQQVSNYLNEQGIGTLLFDLLTEEEMQDRSNVFDIPLLARRLISATEWLKKQAFSKDVPIGYFGASTGAAAALMAAAELKNEISAVVSRGGRPDLAIPCLNEVMATTLLIVGDKDTPVIPLNEKALSYLKNGKLTLVSGATHLFEEPGTLEQVSELAAQWFNKYLAPKTSYSSDRESRFC